ncbi:hypothetical protein ABK040_009321 [Willaertia magna]
MTEKHPKALRVGFLSTAKIGIKVSRSMHQSPFVIPYAVASRSLEKAEQYAKENNFVKAYGSYDELIEDKEIDAIYISVPTSLKKEWTIKAAKAKKHILCDKPFENAQSVREMTKACKENGVFFMDNTMWVHNKRTKQLHDLLNKDERFVGKLIRVSNEFSNNVILKEPNDIRLDVTLEPYGALGDLGWYCCRNILWAFNYELPEKVLGISTKALNSDAISSFEAILLFKGNRRATFNCSFVESWRQGTEFVFPFNSIQYNDFVLPWENEEVYFKREQYNKKPTYEIQSGYGDIEKVICDESSQHVEMFEEFFNACQQPEKYEFWGEESLKNMIVLDALYESGENNGKLITL